jgi:hypothetical protein
MGTHRRRYNKTGSSIIGDGFKLCIIHELYEPTRSILSKREKGKWLID